VVNFNAALEWEISTRGTMSDPPERPKIYHITPVENLPSIVAETALLSDAEMIARGGPQTSIGMSGIKLRRLKLPVACLSGVMVGDCVPFYFCPRSVMLYMNHRGNHPGITYKGGQAGIVHLEADLLEVVQYAKAQGQPWAFSLSNAGAVYTEFRAALEQLHEINWDAVNATDFQSSTVKHSKAAEFLIHHSFPISLIRRIGVHSNAVRTRVQGILGGASNPSIELMPNWYY
jgi:hypothetical protein